MEAVFSFLLVMVREAWKFLLDSSPYILFGLLIGGLLKSFLSTEFVAAHLGRGRLRPVVKAALFGIPLPLCSCGVLPAATALKKRGANKGATMAFLIATPESGVDSISISYALLDPIMTVARPLAAFLAAMLAGIGENILGGEKNDHVPAHSPLFPSESEGCGCSSSCAGLQPKRQAGGIRQKVLKGISYAVDELWNDIAAWFLFGLLLAGIIAAAVPDNLAAAFLVGNGIESMLVMLLIGIPLYICATASTPVAAALILKGVSPGAALVFLLAGPATNITSLSVLFGNFGKRATALYLTAIVAVSLLAGLAVNGIYAHYGLSARAMIGQAGDFLPSWVELTSALAVLVLSVRVFWRNGKEWLRRGKKDGTRNSSCGCETGSCVLPKKAEQAKLPGQFMETGMKR